jgi:hypothetical protein
VFIGQPVLNRNNCGRRKKAVFTIRRRECRGPANRNLRRRKPGQDYNRITQKVNIHPSELHIAIFRPSQPETTGCQAETFLSAAESHTFSRISAEVNLLIQTLDPAAFFTCGQ